MDKSSEIYAFLRRSGWVEVEREADVSFLASGEYNENYRVDAADGRYVLRINHGSQLGLDDKPGDQIAYEFRVLKAVEPSGVTPRAFHVDPHAPLGRGALLMEYLPGGPLDYRRDLDGAAEVFARVHTLAPDPGLAGQPNPVLDIAAESLGLIERWPDHPLAAKKRLLLEYHGRVVALGEAHADELTGRDMVMVNTEVNAGNFLVDNKTVRLVDWEKAVISHRAQDLGHFLVPTTTLWKTDYVFTPEARRAFLERYVAACRALGGALDVETLDRTTRILERTILLRALSWCYMAWREYSRNGRALAHEDTLATINRYLDEMECFLKPWE